jgi:Ribbon-helix-helix protein, copG family.
MSEEVIRIEDDQERRNANLDEQGIDRVGDVRRRRHIADLDKDEDLKPAQFLIPESLYKKLAKIALEKDRSRGSLVREAIKFYLKTIEKPEAEAEVDDKVLDKILNACTDYFGGFEIDDEDGFIEAVKNKKTNVNDLTPNQREKVQANLRMGLKGYFLKPDEEEWLAKFEDLKPDEDWLDRLKSLHEEEEEEED